MTKSSAVSDLTSPSTLDLSALLLSVFIGMFIGASVKSGTIVFCVLEKLPRTDRKQESGRQREEDRAWGEGYTYFVGFTMMMPFSVHTPIFFDRNTTSYASLGATND